MTAVLLHPEFYKAAYSSCGCHDNRMDKIWWNEQWLGYPIGEQYKEGSNVENAHLLSRPLMLVVGELDDNVDPASTMQVVNALVKANKDFDLVVMQLLLADLIYSTDKHEPLWIEHITENGQSVRAVVMKPSIFAIEFIEDEIAIALRYDELFESIHGRQPQNRWDADDHYQLTLTEEDHA